MISLVVGSPRSAKSLWVLTELLKYRSQGKEVFVTNFNQTDAQREICGFHKLEDASTWWEALPSGAVWFVDEVQEVIPQRDNRTPVPQWVKQLSLHGHKDLTVIFVTQDPMQTDVTVRRNTNFTIYVSRILGMARSNVHRFKDYVQKVSDPWRWQQTLKQAEHHEIFKFPKQNFALYISASAHDHIKPRFPKRLLVLPAAALVMALCGWWVYSRWFDRSPDMDGGAAESATAPAAAAGLSSLPENLSFGKGGNAPASAEEWVARFTPRVADIPASAPAYDGFQVQDYPRPLCIISVERCTCYTQQATKLAISGEMCRSYALNGYWDPYKAPPSSTPAAAPAPAPETPQAAPAGELGSGAQPRIGRAYEGIPYDLRPAAGPPGP